MLVVNVISNTDTLPDYTLAPEQVPLVGSLALGDAERDLLKSRIADKLQSQGMALVAHYYVDGCLLYTSPSPRDATLSRMPSSA